MSVLRKVEAWDTFNELRVMVNETIAWMWEQGEPGKSYEGEWEITMHYPGESEDEEAKQDADYWQIQLHCYLIGPGRHYSWSGKTFDEAVKKAKYDVTNWCKLEREEREDNG